MISVLNIYYKKKGEKNENSKDHPLLHPAAGGCFYASRANDPFLDQHPLHALLRDPGRYPRPLACVDG